MDEGEGGVVVLRDYCFISDSANGDFECTLCRQTFSKEENLERHKSSKKHLDKINSLTDSLYGVCDICKYPDGASDKVILCEGII